MWILVVDDTPEVRRVTVSTLERVVPGYCVEAGNGADALKLFNGRIDLVVTDREMPEMDGVELVKAIRAREDGKNVPILMVSGRFGLGDVEEATRAGVDGFLGKPFKLDEFRTKVKEALSKSR